MRATATWRLRQVSRSACSVDCSAVQAEPHALSIHDEAISPRIQICKVIFMACRVHMMHVKCQSLYSPVCIANPTDTQQEWIMKRLSRTHLKWYKVEEQAPNEC